MAEQLNSSEQDSLATAGLWPRTQEQKESSRMETHLGNVPETAAGTAGDGAPWCAAIGTVA